MGSMPKQGRNPAKGLAPRSCVTCGASFQPYRKTTVTCSRSCRQKQPHIQARIREYDRRPERRAKQLENQRRQSLRPERRAAWAEQNLRKYNMTVAELQEMIEQQGNRCAICGDPPTPGTGPATKRLHIDHCHTSGTNRALLCLNCNNGLGRFKDDPSRLRAAADYLEEHA
jgi:hypothetical protein